MDQSCYIADDMTVLNVRHVVERCLPIGATERAAAQFLRGNHLEYHTEEDGRRIIAILRETGARKIKTSITVEFGPEQRVGDRAVHPVIELP